jgi:MYXO-CTERM domain-containing protein
VLPLAPARDPPQTAGGESPPHAGRHVPRALQSSRYQGCRIGVEPRGSAALAALALLGLLGFVARRRGSEGRLRDV